MSTAITNAYEEAIAVLLALATDDEQEPSIRIEAAASLLGHKRDMAHAPIQQPASS